MIFKDNLKNISIVLGAALIYSFSVPFISLLSTSVPTFLKTSFLYFGAAIAMCIILLFERFVKKNKEKEKITKKEVLHLVIICVLDILSSISLMYGLNKVAGDTASLLLSLQTVLTFVFAIILFKEKIGVFGWFGLAFIFVACILTSVNENGFNFSVDSIFIIIPCILWALQNNLNKKINCDAKKVVLYKSLATGIVTLILGLCFVEFKNITNHINILYLFIIGFFCYGIAICLLVDISKKMGAGIGSCYFGINPVLGAVLSILICHDQPYFTIYISIGFVLLGVIFCTINEYRNAKNDAILQV